MKWDHRGIWHPDASRHPGLGLRKGVLDKRPTSDITHWIIHHTGVGILGRFKRQRAKFGWHSPLQAAIHVYTRIMRASGHYLIGWDGELVQIVPDDWIAWHAGYGRERRRSRVADTFRRIRYRQGAQRPVWWSWKHGRYQWWVERWNATRGHLSPLAWFPELDVNGHSLGVELLSTPGADPFTDAQIARLRELVEGRAALYRIPLDEDHVLTHSDACPLARTTPGGRPWDPPPSKYRFEDVFEPRGSFGVKDHVRKGTR